MAFYFCVNFLSVSSAVDARYNKLETVPFKTKLKVQKTRVFLAISTPKTLPVILNQQHIEKTDSELSKSVCYTVKKGSRVSRPQPGCHYQTLSGRE